MEQAAVAQAQLGGAQPGHLPDRVFQAQQTALADVLAQHPGEGAEVSRMRKAAPQRALSGIGGTIGADRAPGLNQRQVHVFLGVMGVDRSHRTVLLDQKIEENVERVGRRRLAFALPGDDAIHGQPLIGIVRADQHPAPVPADGGVMIIPARQSVADVAFHSRPLLRVLQAREQGGAPTLMGPWRDDAHQIVVAPGVGINVGLHIDPAPARLFDQRHDFFHPAPELFVRDFQMDDVHRHAGAFSDFDGLSDRLEDAQALVANVAGVDAAMLAHDLAKFDQVVGRGERTRRHHQLTRKTKGSLLHRLRDQVLHLLQLSRTGPVEGLAHDTLPDVAFADVGSDVDGDSRPLDRGEVLAQGPDLDRLVLDGNRMRHQLALGKYPK